MYNLINLYVLQRGIIDVENFRLPFIENSPAVAAAPITLRQNSGHELSVTQGNFITYGRSL